MILISHRGNLSGKGSADENNPKVVKDVLGLGYDVEVDAWYQDEKFYLGHDAPTHEVDYEFLMHPRIWVHAKNLEAVERFKRMRSVHWFWHESDKICLTNFGHIWCYPGHEVRGGIANDVGQQIDLSLVGGGCSDDIKRFA